MSAGYILSPVAFEDICQIWNYLTEQAGPEVADRMEERLFSIFETLRQFPHLGHRRTDLTHRPVLFFPSRPYIVVYEPNQDRIIIHSVLHGARDLEKTLRGRTPR